MAKKSVTPPTYDKSRNRWKAQIPAGLSDTGKRVRAWFRTRDQAREWQASLVSTAEPCSTIPPSLALKADEARIVLEPHGLDLLEAAKMLSSALGIIGDTGSLMDAAKAWRQAHEARTASKLFGEAAELFLITREGLRDHTLRGYRTHLRAALKPLHHIVMADLKLTEIDELLSPRPSSSRKAIQTTLSTFIRWAGSPPRQWINPAILEGLETIRISADDEISVLDAKAVAALMAEAEAVSPGTAAGFACAIFGGIRMTELRKLTWANVLDDHIEITAAIAKRHSRRLVPICPTLRAWLDSSRGDAAPGDPLVGPNWKKNERVARRKAGWALTTQPPLKGLDPPTRGGWPKNVCRHTCGSILVATGRPLEELIFGFGHSGGTALLKRHYLGRMTVGQAAAILAIGPQGSKISTIHAA
jgi:integrase